MVVVVGGGGVVLDFDLGLPFERQVFLLIKFWFGCLDCGIMRESFEMGILGKMEDLESGKQVMTDQIKWFLAYIDRTVNFLFFIFKGSRWFCHRIYKVNYNFTK